MALPEVKHVGAVAGPIELCRQLDCDQPAQVLIDAELVWMDEAGIRRLGVEPIAMCRLHALQEQENQRLP